MTEKQKIKKNLAQIIKSKNIIAKERDKLRAVMEELESLECELDNGIANIEAGIDEISQSL